MKILLVAYGSRGDVQPSLALALGLKRAGQTVTLMAGENFESWIRSYDLDFLPAPDTEQIMASEVGKDWTSTKPNSPQELAVMRRMFDHYGGEMFGLIGKHIADFDLVLSGFVSLAYVQTAAEKYRVPQINLQLQPFWPTSLGASSLVSFTPKKLIFNHWGGMLSQRLIWGLVAKSVNTIRVELGLKPHSAASYQKAANAIPTVNGFSEQIAPRPDDWPEHVHTVGYWFHDEAQSWTPPQALLEFLTQDPQPIYIGFGSMTSRDPQGMFKLVSDAVAKAGQRAVMITGWSGLSLGDVPSHMYLIDKAPHDWLFQRVKAVIHHGGAGTTAAGLRWGKPTFIIPHMADQSYWGRRVAELGVGPKAVNRINLTMDKLADGIRPLTTDSGIAERSAAIGAKIRAEDGVTAGVQAILSEAKKLGVKAV